MAQRVVGKCFTENMELNKVSELFFKWRTYLTKSIEYSRHQCTWVRRIMRQYS